MSNASQITQIVAHKTVEEARADLYQYTLEKYLAVSKEIDRLKEEYKKLNKKVKYKEAEIEKLQIVQAKLCAELYEIQLTVEDKIYLWENNRDMLPKYDGLGKDEQWGKLVPTQLEVDIGMYKDRSLLEFDPYTCGVFMFYTPDMKNIYIGYSQCIEFYLHSMARRFSKPYHNKEQFKKLYNIMHTPGIRFIILDTCPYSLLLYVENKYKKKYIYSKQKPKTKRKETKQ